MRNKSIRTVKRTWKRIQINTIEMFIVNIFKEGFYGEVV